MITPTANRVRRLLSSRPRFGSKPSVSEISKLETIKEHDATTVELSSSCSADDHSTLSSSGGSVSGYGCCSSSAGTLIHQNPIGDVVSTGDPYADVRERMEAYSQRDRLKFALGSVPCTYPDVPAMIAYTCYLVYAVIVFLGNILNYASHYFQGGRYNRRNRERYPSEDPSKYAPLISNWEKLYTRRVYSRLQDCFNRPISSAAGVNIQVVERVSHDRYKSLQELGNLHKQPPHVQKDYANQPFLATSHDDKTVRQCLNLGSYNYLGFAGDWKETCSESVTASLENYPISTGSCLQEYGKTALHRSLERTVAQFLGKEDAILFNMGFNTNATTLPTLCGPGDLILSDALNHTSIVNGARASGAAISIFRHADMSSLEEVLRRAIILGRPRTRRPWRKIWILVEGVYSMEGIYCDLRSVVRIAKKYGAYLYLDEAHSIGAVGPTGRGCCEYTGVNTADVDIMMGTFTKSFAGMGGYVAADKETISYLRRHCPGSASHNSISPIVCQQVLTAFEIIMGKDGTNTGKQKLQALRDNSNYFRLRLEDMGLQVLGPYDSPVIPVMLYHMTKVAAFSREAFKRGLAVVIVGAPAVPILECRARFCMSAGHTRDDLDKALEQIDEIADLVDIRMYPRRDVCIIDVNEDAAADDDY